jgi:hypothetical protein
LPAQLPVQLPDHVPDHVPTGGPKMPYLADHIGIRKALSIILLIAPNYPKEIENNQRLIITSFSPYRYLYLH